jgi:rSAM/selenodomain-associated transferase 2
VTVAVLIPARNEESTIAAAIESAWEAGAAEVIVADGGSIDSTVARALTAGAEVISAAEPRGRLLNRAARLTRSEVLLILHADSRLQPSALRAVENAVKRGVIFGGFRIRFPEKDRRLILAAALINLRSRMTRSPWGDQAQFIRRDVFLREGGFREDPFMEDYEMANRMKTIGAVEVLPEYVLTSGRRFVARGLIRTAALNWRIIAAYRRGADPSDLEKLYRRG